MKKNLRFTTLIFILMLVTSLFSYAQTYLRAGGSYLLPMNKLNEINKPVFGYTIEIKNCKFCNLWYGFNFTTYSMKKSDSILLSETYYNKITLFEPSVRYNFISNTNQLWGSKLIPYAELTGIISSMDKTDNENKLGLGYSLGLGTTYSFQAFKHCWHLDLKGTWVNPNPIVYAKTRQSIQYIDLKLNIGVELW